MQYVRIVVTKLVSDDFPGWVEFTLTGADGEIFRFVDKAPIVAEGLASEYPFESRVACHIVKSIAQPDGTEIVDIDTSPWGIETGTGQSRFLVRDSQLVDSPYAA